MKLRVETDKRHLADRPIKSKHVLIASECGWVDMNRTVKENRKWLTESWRRVTCGRCKRTVAYKKLKGA